MNLMLYLRKFVGLSAWALLCSGPVLSGELRDELAQLDAATVYVAEGEAYVVDLNRVQKAAVSPTAQAIFDEILSLMEAAGETSQRVTDSELGRAAFVELVRSESHDPGLLLLIAQEMDELEGTYPQELTSRVSMLELFELLAAQSWSAKQISGLIQEAAEPYLGALLYPDLPFRLAREFPDLDYDQISQSMELIKEVYRRAFRIRMRQLLMRHIAQDFGDGGEILSLRQLAMIAVVPLEFERVRDELWQKNNPIPSCGYSNRSSINAVQHDLRDIYTEATDLKSRVDTAKTNLEDLKQKVEKIESLCATLITAKENADRANTVITILKPLPYVGQVATAAGVALNIVRTPLNAAYNPAKTLKPKMTTAKNALGPIITGLGSTSTVLGKLITESVRVDAILCYGDNCATGTQLDALASKVAQHIANINSMLTNINQFLTLAEQWIQSVTPQFDFLTANFEWQIGQVSIQLENLLGPLLDLYDGINVHICDPFGWGWCIYLMDFLDSTIGWIVDYISQFIDPLLENLWDALDIEMPTLPDLSDLFDLDLPTLPSFNVNLAFGFDVCGYALDILSCIPQLSTYCPGLDELRTGTSPVGRYVNGQYISTPYGYGYHVDTSGSGQYGYTFYGYEPTLHTALFGRIVGSGRFRQYDTFYGSLPQGRRYLRVYAIATNGTIAGSTEVLNYNDGTTWKWKTFTISGLNSGQKYWLAVGRGDGWSTDWKLTAEWTDLIP